MRHGSLFSGIGGFDLAAQWMGWENVFQVEWDGFCQKVLAKNFPNVKRYGDIREFDGTEYRGAIDILSGGFPCQPFSQAGKRKGKEDDRHLWPEYLRVIREIKPSYVIGENVIGIIDMELDNIITDLESEGYTTEQFIIPACAIGAIHKRDRLWIIAHTKSKRWIQMDKGKQKRLSNIYFKSSDEIWGYCSGLLLDMEPNWSKPGSGIIRNDDGLSDGVDRLKGLGNAIVPQVAFQLFKAIEQYEKSRRIRNI